MLINVITDGIRKPVGKAVKRFVAAERNAMSKIIQELVLMKHNDKMRKDVVDNVRRGSEPTVGSDFPDAKVPSLLSRGRTKSLSELFEPKGGLDNLVSC